MTAHYLVDLFNPTVGNSELIDVRNPPDGESLINGSFIVRVPGGVSVKNPTDLTDLITKKYTGLLAFYAGFTDIIFDDQLDATGVNAANSVGVLLGGRLTNGLREPGANPTLLESVPVALGGSPTQALITWECFELQDSDVAGARFERTYVEVSAGAYTCEVSFDNGVNFNSTMDGAVLSIPVPEQGSDFIIRFVNVSGTPAKTFIGSWAVIF